MGTNYFSAKRMNYKQNCKRKYNKLRLNLFKELFCQGNIIRIETKKATSATCQRRFSFAINVLYRDPTSVISSWPKNEQMDHLGASTLNSHRHFHGK